MVSEGISQRIMRPRTSCVGGQRNGQRRHLTADNETTHILCGWTKEWSAKASHSGLMRTRTTCVGGQRNGQRRHLTADNETTHILCGWTKEWSAKASHSG